MKLSNLPPLNPKLPNLGSLWMLVAALGFAIMGALVKVGAQKFSGGELVFYRSIFGLLVIWLYIAANKLPLATPVMYKQMSRALVGFASLVLFFYAIAHLPLATAITLNYTSPLFLAVFTPFLLHEKPKKTLFISLIIGFFGVSLLLKPSFNSADWLAGSLGLLSGVGAALAYVHVKQLGKANEPDWRTVFYFTLISTIGAGLWMLFASFHQVEWQDLPVLLGLGLSATIAQLAMTRAYRTGNTLVVASLAYVTVLLASLFGVIWWQEHLSFDAWIAIALIILSGVISIRATP
ncbi:DMT family transporter [Methylotenera sp.]|uniref:DMT family transporter n=1 Tax=Methylotenera sp. TaxID=2051956 RepID=UPI0027170930|nr:DMT family transporter [Methylotenera sp.]MDO9393503.1 DMT family transporter [Methylotenera sp.]MDP1523228.1 DMT family transporter [Methylotenera sp.]MDP2071447.1 DMT family transporter [Methylotenera sp.]MDP2230394.1 DMT family transporter [Methylotenera sp.]MDP3005408.1 DMT family transporter [Methylotenera sp.]